MRKYFILSCMLVLSYTVYSQSMDQLFISMPDSLLPLINQDKKTELVESLKSGQEGKTVNRLKGETILSALTPDYFFLQSTQQSSLEGKLLPVNEYYKIICLIKTYCGPACESDISFYTTDWKPLSNTYFTGAEAKDFLENLSSEKCNEVRVSLDMTTIRYKLDKDSERLTATLTLKEYLSREEYEKIESCIKEDISYEWKDTRFQ